MRTGLRWGAALVAVGMISIAGLGVFGSASSARARSQARRAVPARAVHGRVAVIVMENHEYGDVIGSSAAPFINGLARRYALARGMHAVTHPSLPNYLALTGGSTFGINSDCTDCSVGATSIVDQLQHSHVSWKAYMENLPHPCFTGAGAGEYAKRHDPFVYYTRVVTRRAWCRRVVPLSQLGSDERARTLPRFIWITPNLCHDMHDCSVGTGDRFLSSLVPRLLGALGPHGVLFLTWDEGTSNSGCCGGAAGGHVATIVAGPGAKRGARLNRATDHYSVLATVERLLGLPRLRGAASGATASLAPLVAGH